MPCSLKAAKVCFSSLSSADGTGKLWYTAAFSSIERENDREVIFAEGGKAARCSKEGVYWYPSEEEAKRALEKAVVVSFIELKNCDTRTPRAGRPEDSRALVDRFSGPSASTTGFAASQQERSWNPPTEHHANAASSLLQYGWLDCTPQKAVHSLQFKGHLSISIKLQFLAYSGSTP